jgi:hypothetical protein
MVLARRGPRRYLEVSRAGAGIGERSDGSNEIQVWSSPGAPGQLLFDNVGKFWKGCVGGGLVCVAFIVGWHDWAWSFM